MKDLEKFIKALKGAEEYLKKELIENVANACIKVQSKARKYAPVETGTLRRSIQVKIDKSELKGQVGTNLIYAAPLEFGAKIKPRKAKVLMIPADRKTKELVAKYGGVREAISSVGGKLVYQKTKVKDKEGNVKDGIMAYVVSNGRVVMKFYMTAKEIKIEPREYFKKAYEEIKKEFPQLIFKKLVNPFLSE